MSSIPGRVARPSAAPARKRRSAEDVRQQLHDHLRKTARFIKYLDAVVLMFALAASLLGLWLTACVIDHWLFPLSQLGRWSIWSVGVAGTLWWSLRHFLPLLLGRINPTYAAQRIEHLVPEFKNGLVSWLELESMSDHGVPRGVMAAIAYRSARFLGGQDPSSTVDTSPLIKLVGCFLLLLVSLALYMMLSPKSAFVTAERVLMPWRSVEPPSRVHFQSIEPGTVELTEGEPLTVDVEVNGLRREEPVVVLFTTRDGQFQRQRVELPAVTEGFRYSGQVKTTSVGVEHALSYWLEAGDAVAGPFEVSLNPLPSVVLESVELQFPKYTRLPPQTVTGREIEAVEGTVAHFMARANQSMRRGRVEIGAEVDDRGKLVRASAYAEMDVDDRRLTADWLMRLNSDGENPTQLGYRIRGYNHRGNVNPNPILHRMTVLADVAPEIELLGPESRTMRVHPSARVNLEVRAIDPDFGLNRIDMSLAINGKQKSLQTILEGDGIVGRQVKMTQLDLSKLPLTVGDRIQIRATALDNRHNPQTQTWEPNTSQSEPLMLEVVGLDQPDDVRSQPPPSADQQPAPQQPDASAGGQENATGEGTSGDGGTSPASQAGSESAGGGQGAQASDSQTSGRDGAEGSQGGAGGSSPEGDQTPSEAPPQNSGGAGSSSSGESNPTSATSGSGQQSSESGGQGTQRSAEGSQTSAGQQRGASADDPSASGSAAGERSANAAEGAGRSGELPSAEQSRSDREALDRVREFMQSQQSQSRDSANSQQQSASQPQNNLGGRGQESPSPNSDSADAANSASENKQNGSGQSENQQTGASPQSEQALAEQTSSSAEQSGTQQAGTQQAGAQQSGAQQSGAQQSGAQQSGAQQSGAQQSGSPPTAAQQSGTEQSGAEKPGAEQSGAQQSGAQQSGAQPQAGSQSSGAQNSGSQPSVSQPSTSEQASSEQSGAGADASAGQPSDSQSSGSQSSGSQSSGSESSGSQSSGSEQSGSPPSTSEPSGSQESGAQPSSSERSGSSAPQADSQAASGSQQSDSQESGSQQSGSQESGSQQSGAPESGSQQSESQQSGSQQSGGESSASSSGSQSSSSQSSGSQPPSGSGGGPSTGNTSSGENSTQGGAGGGAGERDAVNEQDAAQTTNLVLDYLNRQKDQPDPELLREVDWTEAELREFVDRWTEARDLASQGDEAAQRRWQELLRGLELGPSAGTARSGSGNNDTFQQMRDSGTRMRPPESLRKQYEAFRRAMQKP